MLYSQLLPLCYFFKGEAMCPLEYDRKTRESYGLPKKWFAKISPSLLMMQILISVLHKLWQLMWVNGILILCMKWWKPTSKSALNYVLSSYNRTNTDVYHLRKVSIFSIQATKIPLYSPICQSLSSSNNVLINNILTQIELKKTKT